MFLILLSIHSIFDTPFAESAEGGKMEKRSHFPCLFSVWLISMCCGVMKHFTPLWTYIHTSSKITCTTWQLQCNVSRGVLSSHLTRMLLCWRCFCSVSLCLPGCDYMAACTSTTRPPAHSDCGHELKWHLNDNLSNRPVMIAMIKCPSVLTDSVDVGPRKLSCLTRKLKLIMM